MKRENQKIKVVLDTNVFISSIFWIGNPHKIVELAFDKIVEEKILKRDFKEDQAFVERQIALILEYAKIVRPINKLEIVKADPDDNKILECAFTAKADYIVSGDPHLYTIKEVAGIKILKPKEFLDKVLN
ncbi:putative toxin-antitoxin system toxin component, PIN family [Candidatus Woesearchaeota archaeon]|nr:putative toxin-antitoxin system toxin component, PIN family [Candidatus Woesearchaeota archaeon]